MRRSAVLAAALAAAAVTLPGCGGDGRPVRIGLLTDCAGFFAPLQNVQLAAADVALLSRGGEPVGKKPSDGVRGVRAGGRRVELVQGCTTWTSLSTLVEQTRLLVERDRVSAVIGPTFGATDPLVLRELARKYPHVAFLLGPTPTQEATLRDPAPNVFRFGPDGAQLTAGLGSYAYHRLGWRRAAVVAADFSPRWPEAAGFTAEFCALGGRVDRIPTPRAGGIPATLATAIPARDDGVALISDHIGETVPFVASFAKGHRDFAKRLVLGPSAYVFVDAKTLSQALPLLRGLRVTNAAPFSATAPGWQRFRVSMRRWYPGVLPADAIPANYPLPIAFYDAVTAVLHALDTARGDGAQLLDALADLRLETPIGPMRLDRDRQAVVNVSLSTLAAGPGGKPVFQTLGTLHEVDQSFGGYFTAKTPSPSPDRLDCRRATPPAWAR